MRIHAVLMLKAPRPGTVKTRLAASVGDERAVSIYRQLAEHQIRQIPPGWQCSVHFAPQDAREEMHEWLADVVPPGSTFYPQCEGDLGARMRHAAMTEFHRGAGAVALLGGDCPGLLTPILCEVESTSPEADVVIVPATDGGYVLLLLKADHPELFDQISWSTPEVLPQTLTAAAQGGITVRLLGPLADVDDVKDLSSPESIFSSCLIPCEREGGTPL